MKHSKIILFFVVLAVFSSCKKFDEFQENPNNPTIADPSLLLPMIDLLTLLWLPANLYILSRPVTNNTMGGKDFR